MTNDSNRERFKKLLDAKKQGRTQAEGGGRPGGKGIRPEPPKVDRTFKRRKV